MKTASGRERSPVPVLHEDMPPEQRSIFEEYSWEKDRPVVFKHCQDEC